MKKYITTQKILLLFVLFLPFSFTFGQLPLINPVCLSEWKNEADAVVRIKNNAGDFFTGVLLNTTAGENNNQHFVLTANTNIPNGNSPDLSNWKFYWHYESSTCTPDGAPNEITTTGATLVAKSQYGDFALLVLDEDPAEAWDVTPYYLGWDNSGSVPTGTTALIYYPLFDYTSTPPLPLSGIKKILVTNKTVTHDWWKWFVEPCNGVNERHNYRYWTMDMGQYPEFGAPLLNSNSKLIGHFSDSDCGAPGTKRTCEHYFSKFSWAWVGFCDPSPFGRLNYWLDPLNTDQATLDGRNVCQNTIRLWRSLPRSEYHAVQNIISRQEIPNDADVTYKAGIEIVLEDGFHAKHGADFHAYIEELDCNSTRSVSYSPQSDDYYNDIIEEPNFSLSQSQIQHSLNLLPNPNPGTFQLETNFPLSDIGNLKISSLMGVTIYEAQNVTSNTIQLQNSASGQYFVVMILKDGSVLTQKMVVQR